MAAVAAAEVDVLLTLTHLTPLPVERVVAKVRVTVGDTRYGQGVCDALEQVARRLPVNLADILEQPAEQITMQVYADLSTVGTSK
jgi:hypothetical protein